MRASPRAALLAFAAVTLALPFALAADEPASADAPVDPDHAREIFVGVLPKLERAVDQFDEGEELPDKTWLWGADKESNQREIDELLDEAIDILSDSALSEARDRIRVLQDKAEASRLLIADYRQRRALARPAGKTSGIDRVNPFVKTREDYDDLIEDEEKALAAWRQEIEKEKIVFRETLASMGVDISPEGVDALLATVSGDDFVRMCSVFDNLKQTTVILRRLTDESGESLDVAKRYYGMYMIIAQILDRIQKVYVRTIYETYIPQLQEFESRANENIAEARRLIRNGQGDERILQSNIAANELTISAVRKYVDYLEDLARFTLEKNRETERIVATAVNTYRTVSVSSNLADLIREGSMRFDQMLRLEMPPLREFQNAQLRREFERLTTIMTEDR